MKEFLNGKKVENPQPPDLTGKDTGSQELGLCQTAWIFWLRSKSAPPGVLPPAPVLPATSCLPGSPAN